MASSRDQITEAVWAFVKARSSAEGKQIVKAYRHLLLTDAADAVLAKLLTQKRNNEKATRILEGRRRLLMRCRREGIDTVFVDDYLHPTVARRKSELAVLLKELPHLTKPSDMPRKIAVCQAALTLLNRDSQPDLWASLHGWLGNSFNQNPRGNRAENLERAIGHFEQTLKVYTRQELPKLWAVTQNNLANAYSDRIRGNRAENLEEAIRRCERALEVRTPQDFPEDWAATQNNLAIAYAHRIRGDRAENLERAIEHSDQTLKVYTREGFPEDWARIQHTLGTAYLNRIRGDRAENLEEAIRRFEQALEVYTCQDFPKEWASIQNNLADAYSDRIRGNRAENLEEAIRGFGRALEVYTHQDFPEDWAMAQHNLGRAYTQRIRGDRAENLEEAICCYRQALEVYTREGFPEMWAKTQHNLADAYRKRIRGDRAENLEEAIRRFRRALEIRSARWFPQACRDTAFTLGHLLYDEHRFPEARTAFTMAHEAVEALRGQIQREGAKRDLAEQNVTLYARLVSCCLRDEDVGAAFRYAVAGKGRTFVDMLATARFDLSAAGADNSELATDLRQARALHQQIDNLLAQLVGDGPLPSDGPDPRYPGAMRADLRTLKEQEAALWEEMAYKYPALTATQQAPSFAAEEASTLAAALSATLVEYYQHADGWSAFVVTSDEVRHVPLPGIDDDLLGHALKWLRRIESRTGRGELSYMPLRRLHEGLIAPLRAYLPLDGVVVLAPFAHLHLLPLAATLDPSTDRYATEDYTLVFTPSLAALWVALEQQARRAQTPETGSVTSGWLTKVRGTLDRVQWASSAGGRTAGRLLSVAYPGAQDSRHYLPNVLPEAEAVARHFTRVARLHQDAATPDAVLAHARGQDVVHLGCHGTFDPETPERSGLRLSGGWLTVQRIIAELHLDRTRLATIGACLSGRMKVRLGEEHVGLLQAIMSAGAPAVVASLWPVHDAATRVLFEVFYAETAAGDAPAGALVDASRLVRSRPGWEHPYYWAAFQISGLAHGPHKPQLSHLSDEVVKRIEQMHAESVRGGSTMSVAKTVRDGQVLLEQMAEEPEAVLEELDDPEEQARIVAELRTLDDRAAKVRTEADLMYLADAVHRLVEETPGLAALLLPRGMDVEAAQNQRTITAANYYEATSSESQYAQQHAAQMRNDVVECRQKLEQALQGLPQEKERQ